MLPHKLKNFRVFNDGQDYLGVASEVELPKLKMASEEYRGSGMLAPVDIDLGLEKLELTTTYGGIVVGVLACVWFAVSWWRSRHRADAA